MTSYPRRDTVINDRLFIRIIISLEWNGPFCGSARGQKGRIAHYISPQITCPFIFSPLVERSIMGQTLSLIGPINALGRNPNSRNSVHIYKTSTSSFRPFPPRLSSSSQTLALTLSRPPPFVE